ncbi:MAG: ABC-F family ATP-binding cassette domain-containing protein [Candidatus Magasanikbacteria bacterium]|nr:ABC-F family ATP-binding cassette domain-containing protein [Candidatus Magasanikbacteria bacterium]
MSTLVQVTNLNKSFGPRMIFDNATVTIAERQKIGVIGRNGAGKSTLLKIIVGEEEYNSGEVQIHDRARIGYLTQHDPFTPEEKVMEFLQRMSNKEVWECAKMLSKFQVGKELHHSEIGSLAGGFQMRVKLTAMLLQDPNLLFLDEPTNYLDVSTQILLEQFLQTYRGGFLVVSHDREFLKNTCTETLEVDQGKLAIFPGGLEDYLQYKEDQLEMAQRFNKKVEREKKHLQSFVDRFRASKATQAQSKLKQIGRLHTIDIVHPMSTARIMIPAVAERKGVALHSTDLEIGYPDKIIAKNINVEIGRGEHIAIVGDNGQGKSTFLKTIAGRLEALSGIFRWGPHISVGYYAQHVAAQLQPHEQVIDYLNRVASPYLKSDAIMAMAGNFLFKNDDIKKPISVLSGGEKARLVLAGLLLEEHSVLLLDEPTNHLDFETVEALARALSESNRTIIFVSHNRTFVNLVATGIIEVGGGVVKRYLHNYEEYIYHLQQQYQPEREEKYTPEPLPARVPENQRKALRTEIRGLQKEAQEIEHELAVLEHEKQKLHAWFARHAGEYSRVKIDALKATEEDLEKKEAGWLELQEKIVGLEAQL